MAKEGHPSAILSANMAWLMDQHKDELGSQPKVADKTRPKIGQRTVGRALKGKVSTTMGTLASLAHAFRVEPWELLHPTAIKSRKAKLSDQKIEEVEKAKRMIAEWEPAQRDLFRNATEIKTLLQREPFPIEDMDKDAWTSPEAKTGTEGEKK